MPQEPMEGQGCHGQVSLWGAGRRRNHRILKHGQNVEKRKEKEAKSVKRENLELSVLEREEAGSATSLPWEVGDIWNLSGITRVGSRKYFE